MKTHTIKFKNICLRVDEEFFNKMVEHKEKLGFSNWESYIHALFMKGRYK